MAPQGDSMNEAKNYPPIRIGILGAAKIAPQAVIHPARQIDDAEVVAVAARSIERAQEFAGLHDIPRSFGSYAELLADQDIDAIYIPLPNALHGDWTIRSLQAGKAVLCEKPAAANAQEAAQVAKVVEGTGQLMMEAYHWRYHALAARMREILDSGEIGKLRRVSVSMCFPLLSPGDIRWQWPLAGGALMDCCYTVNIARFLARSEPTVVSASCKTRGVNIDRYMQAELRFESGVSGRIEVSMFSSKLLKLKACVMGNKGEMQVLNPVLPQMYNRLSVRTAQAKRREKIGGDSSYLAQLKMFVRAQRGEIAVPSDAADAVRNMQVIDAIYRKAGLPPRVPFSSH